MSFPNIPNVTPSIRINRDTAVNLLLASVAFEELGLSHVINAEAEKIQFVVGTLGEQRPFIPPTITELVEIDDSVNRTMRDVIKNQMLLQFKLEDIIEFQQFRVHVNTATVTAVFNGTIYTASDSAYYHTEGGMM